MNGIGIYIAAGLIVAVIAIIFGLVWWISNMSADKREAEIDAIYAKGNKKKREKNARILEESPSWDERRSYARRLLDKRRAARDSKMQRQHSDTDRQT